MSFLDLNYTLALGTLLLQVVTIILLGVFLLRKKVATFGEIAESVASWGFWIALIASIGSAIVTLYYSEVLGFEPCPLCWWQRIFLYPQVILLGMALWKKDTYMAEYSIVLSFIGAGIALYHHVLQMAPKGTLPCPATGTVSCADRTLFEFGYVTYPMMALTLFAFLIVIMLFVRAGRKID